MTAVTRGRLALVSQGGRPQGGALVEEQAAVCEEGRLVLADQQQRAPACRQHLCAQAPLAQECIAGRMRQTSV
jgi:hypothetical protein